MEIVEIRSTAVQGPDSVMISAEVHFDLKLGELQEQLLREGIDPMDLDNLNDLMKIIKEKAIMSPFRIQDVRLSHASHEGLVVVMDLAVEVEPRYPAQELRDRYARLLLARLEQTSIAKVLAENQN